MMLEAGGQGLLDASVDNNNVKGSTGGDCGIALGPSSLPARYPWWSFFTYPEDRNSPGPATRPFEVSRHLSGVWVCRGPVVRR